MNQHRSSRQELDLPLSPAALLQACATEPYAFALVGTDERSWACGKSFLGFAPSAVLRITANGDATCTAGAAGTRWTGHPLALLQRFVERFGGPPNGNAADDGEDMGFVVAALSYELRTTIERLRTPRPVPAETVVLHAAAYDWLAIFDHRSGRTELRRRPGADADLGSIADDLRHHANRHSKSASSRAALGEVRLTPEFTAEEHRRAVIRALDYIRAGDIYQVNVAQRFRAEGRVDPAALFATLQDTHPVPFAAYVDTGTAVLVSNSPECFLTLDGARVATFPIKGTRPRASGAAADRELERALAADPKELAEHIMIVDLERNDLGRVCTIGSVGVRDLLHVESFPSLHHLVSEVRGTLRPDIELAALLRAMFPGGSITGAPKIRAMEVIDAVESSDRGFYTGAIGLLGRRWARLNIAIRTATVTPERLVYHAGGGIVADSQPQREYDEILLKAQPLAAVLQASAA